MPSKQALVIVTGYFETFDKDGKKLEIRPSETPTDLSNVPADALKQAQDVGLVVPYVEDEPDPDEE